MNVGLDSPHEYFSYKVISIINHSEIGVMFTNLAIERGPHIVVGKMIHSKSLNVGSVDYVGMVQYLRCFLGTNIHVFSCENPENGMVLDPEIVIKRSIMVLGKR